jgi:hypothetical protein
MRVPSEPIEVERAALRAKVFYLRVFPCSTIFVVIALHLCRNAIFWFYSNEFLEKMPIMNNSRTSIPELVSLRFCSMALGMRYAQVTAFMRRNGINPASGALRRWSDVSKNLSGRIIGGKSLEILVRHVDPMASGITPVEVPSEVLEEIKRAWAKVAARGSDLLVAAPPKKRWLDLRRTPTRKL